MRKALTTARWLSIGLVAGALALALISSFAVGRVHTRAILALDAVVQKFGARDFSVRSDIKTADEVGRLSANFNSMAQIIQDYSARLEALLSQYGKFVPHDLLKMLDRDSILDVRLGDQVQREMTVLFSDIRAFTTLSEEMTPRENFNFLNSYLGRVGPIIRKHGGIIDKYIGDAVMAIFPGRPDDALAAAIDIAHDVIHYNNERARAGYRPIDIGTGVHTGRLMLGTIGEEKRMDGTVIADAVNLSSRLEGLTRHYGVHLLTTDAALNGAREQWRVRFVDQVRVKGRAHAIRIYEVLDAAGEEERKRRLDSLEDFNTGVAQYQKKEFSEAVLTFRRILEDDPHDSVAEIYLNRCIKLAQNVPDGWDGIIRMDEK